MAKENVAGKSSEPKCAEGWPSVDSSFEVGKSYLIRGVSMYHTGRLISITHTDLLLEDAAWIADTGRFSTALTTGALSEIEPFVGPVIIPRGAIVDATEWKHPLPREQK